MAKKISVGIDIGSAMIKVIVAESYENDPKTKPQIIGIGYAESDGVRHGYIINQEDTARSLRYAIHQAQKTSGYRIEKAYFSIGCEGMQGITSTGTVVLESKESTVTQSDIEMAIEQSQANINPDDIRNKEILHTIPLSYKVDNKQVSGKVLGMIGEKIEVKTFFITVATQHIASLTEVAKLAKINIEDIIASPLTSSVTLLSKSQLIAGCGMINMGAETISCTVFENGVPICLDISPIGSRQITHDIALGFKVGLEEAERIKVSRIDSLPYPRRKIEEIVKARLEDACDFIQGTLKKNNKQGLLPAGILITGGAALNIYIEDLIKEKVRLPSKKIGIKFDKESKVPVPDATWSVAYGLATIGIESNESQTRGSPFIRIMNKGLSKSIKDIKRFFKKILP